LRGTMISLGKTVAHDIKVGAPVAAVTTAAGVGGWLDIIPASDISKIGLIIGIILSVVLIVTHTTKGIIEWKKGNLEIKLKELEIEEAQNENNNES